MRNRVASLNRQTGVVLVVSMVMLLLLTLIGLTGAQVTSLEEKMAGNARDQNLAFQAAESTLLVAERFALGGTPWSAPNDSTTYDNQNGLLDFLDLEPDFFNANTWVNATSTAAAGFGANFGNNLGTVIADPRFIIKRIAQLPSGPPGPSGDKTYFRITVRAVGINPGTQVILQEILEREEP